MPIQIIITGNDPQEVRNHMADILLGQKVEPLVAPLVAEPNGGAGEAVATEAEAPKKRSRGRPPKAPEPEPEAEIETGEEVAEADDLDEVVDDSGEATADDVRATLTELYLERYGRENTQKDILKLYAMRFPDGSVAKVSDIPEGMHGQVIEDIREMSTKNPFKRARIDTQK